MVECLPVEVNLCGVRIVLSVVLKKSRLVSAFQLDVDKNVLMMGDDRRICIVIILKKFLSLY